MTFATPPVVTPRQHADKIGFTPFAYSHLISLTGEGEDGFPTDTKKRVFIMGGTTHDGKRIRREVRGTILNVFTLYVADPTVVRLWVQWKDGRRHLVHRKA